jgi:hypothetical protein
MTPNQLIRVSQHWTLQEQKKAHSHYKNDADDPLTISYFGVMPDIKADVDNPAELRSFYRSFAEMCMVALIEVERCDIAGLTAVRSIVKSKPAGVGSIYVGGYTLPFHDCSIVLRVQCMENTKGETHAREATVKKRYEGRPDWEEDAYDPSYRGKYMRNQSDDVRYDADFPDHPLSRVRRYLAELPNCIEIAPDIKRLSPFVYDPNRVPVPKSRWKFWA